MYDCMLIRVSVYVIVLREFQSIQYHTSNQGTEAMAMISAPQKN